MRAGGADFVGLGYCGNDFVALLPEIPYDNKVEIISQLIQGGGPAATSAVAASRLGWSAAFAGVVGDDDSGRRIMADFAAEKVDCGALRIRQGAASPLAYCWIDAPSGKRSVAWSRGNAAPLTPEELDQELIAGAKILHLDGHHPAAAVAAAQIAHGNGALVCFDAGAVRQGTSEIMAHTDILIASEFFARQWSRKEDLHEALSVLAENNSAVTLITMGEKGSMAWNGGRVIYCPAFKIRAVDTTGAGDVFHAAFEIRFAECGDLLEAMRFASGAAALKCLQPGGRTGIPDRESLNSFLHENQENIR